MYDKAPICLEIGSRKQNKNQPRREVEGVKEKILKRE